METNEDIGDHLLGYFILIRVGCNKVLKFFILISLILIALTMKGQM